MIKITKEQIKDFVNEFYKVDLYSDPKDEDIATYRIFYYYLCYEYSTDVISSKNLAISVGRKQHGVVLRTLDRMHELHIYEKDLYLKYKVLEEKFLEKYPKNLIENYEALNNRSYQILKNRLKKSIIYADKKRVKIKSLENKIKKLSN